jgi:hypothetical protein
LTPNGSATCRQSTLSYTFQRRGYNALLCWPHANQAGNWNARCDTQ